MTKDIKGSVTYDLKRALPNKLLNADGSITDFSGNIISPANEIGAEVYKKSKAIADKFVTENGSIETLAEISQNSVVVADVFIVVETLPKVGQKNKIYLVPSENGMFNEYYYNDNDKWDKMGDVDIDLTNYPTFEQMDTAINIAIFGALGGEY